MSELITNNTKHIDFRKHLLATASLLAFTSLAIAPAAYASDADRPTVWIELGGQAEFTRGTSSPFTAPFMEANADSPVFTPFSPVDVQKAPRFSFGEEGKISIQPEHSNWIFSASLRYGRSGAKRYVHQQVPYLFPTTSAVYKAGHKSAAENSYEELRGTQSETHFVLDFQAGRDVGVGLFGGESTAIISAGVRMARLSSSADINMRGRPDVYFTNINAPANPILKYKKRYHHYLLSGSSERNFRGLGPSVSLNGSVPVVGNPDAGELAVDWGANAAVLFGRQRANVHHRTTGFNFTGVTIPFYGAKHVSPYNRSAGSTRSHAVVVPNVGGNFAIAYRFEAAKLDVGYRADLFFNAMDTGIDTRQTSSVLFHGPYATLSIGLGR